LKRSVQYASFEVGGHCLGISVLEVQEVLREQRLTPVPLAPRAIAGLINLRGQIIPALEMRTLLQLPERLDSDGTLSVVLRTETGPVSLQVDEIGDVIEIATGLDAPPLNLDSRIKRLLSGVCRMKEKLLLVLDTERAVDLTAEYAHSGPELNGTKGTGN
jgi:purine-binding chemotaxis protein CheW